MDDKLHIPCLVSELRFCCCRTCSEFWCLMYVGSRIPKWQRLRILCSLALKQSVFMKVSFSLKKIEWHHYFWIVQMCLGKMWTFRWCCIKLSENVYLNPSVLHLRWSEYLLPSICFCSDAYIKSINLVSLPYHFM